MDYGVETTERHTIWLQAKVCECGLGQWPRLYTSSVMHSATVAAVCGLWCHISATFCNCAEAIFNEIHVKVK